MRVTPNRRRVRGHATIPHQIHQIWVGGPLPDHLAAYCDTWKHHHPQWGYQLWTEANMPRLHNQQLYDQAEKIAPRNVGQLRADIARYEILFEHGGLYVDCDMECLRPIEALLDGVTCFAGWEVPGRWVNNAVLGATPEHSFIGELIGRLAHNVIAHRGARPNILSGPQFLTPIYRRHAATVTVFPKDHFYPYLYNELDRQGETFPDSFGAHHWHNRRTNR